MLKLEDFKSIELNNENIVGGRPNQTAEADVAALTREQYYNDGSGTGSGSDTYIGFD